VITGFTASELMTALAVTLKLSQTGEPFFRNCYPRVVTAEGNIPAQKLMAEVMEPCDSEWRGLGVIPQSGMTLRPQYAAFDARKVYTTCRRSPAGAIPPAAAATCCRASAARWTAGCSARCARRSIPWGRAWSPARAPARRIISTEVTNNGQG
jgi:hydrogenase expression/formation protein HypD